MITHQVDIRLKWDPSVPEELLPPIENTFADAMRKKYERGVITYISSHSDGTIDTADFSIRFTDLHDASEVIGNGRVALHAAIEKAITS